MSKPNVGDQIALTSGLSGKVWGVQETAEGVFVQFHADGPLHLVEAGAAPADEPVEAIQEPAAVAEAEHEAAGAQEPAAADAEHHDGE